MSNTHCSECGIEPSVFRITFPDGSWVLVCEEHALSHFSAPADTVREIITL